MSQPERMTVMDVPFWDYGQGKLRQTAGPIARIDGAPDADLFRERVARVVEWGPMLRQRIVPSPGGILRPRWVDDPEFDLDFHFRTVSVPAPGDDAAFWRLISDLYRLPFDMTRPVWEIYYITGLADGSSAIMYRAPHFNLDGLSCIDLVKVISDECGDLIEARQRIERRAGRPPISTERSGPKSSASPKESLTKFLEPLRKVGESIGHKSESIWPHNDVSWQRTVVGTSLDMATVKDIRKRTRTTLTAIFQTAVSFGLQEVLDDLPDELTVSLPMSTRHLFPRNHPLEMNSRQVSSPFRLPLGIDDPARRLEVIAERLDELKLERESFVRTVQIARFAPHQLIYLATRRKILASNLISSAAPGPKKHIHLDGHTITALHLYTAVVPHNPLAIVGSSYADNIDVGITADPTLVPRVLDLPKALNAGLEHLALSVGR